MQRLSVLAAFWLAVATPASAESALAKLLPPDEQGQLRRDKPVTIGLPVVDPYNLPGHLQLRPTGWLLVGAGYDAALLGDGKADLGSGYALEAQQHSATLYVHYYPFERSGFYGGIGAEERFGTYTVARTTDGGASQLTARGSYRADYGGPVFGWSWLWANGVTVGADLSKRKRWRGATAVEALVPDNPTSLAGDVERQVTPDLVLGAFMLGYSF